MNEDMRCRPIIFDTPNNPESVEQVKLLFGLKVNAKPYGS